jgi:hypothetical protein
LLMYKSSNGSMCMDSGPVLRVATSVGIKCGL